MIEARNDYPLPYLLRRLGARGYTLLPVTDDQREVALAIFASSRWEELADSGWSTAEKEAFLRQQFTLQDSAYRKNYEGACLDFVRQGETILGRLYLHARPQDIRVMDIALFPRYRNQGHGTALLGEVLHQAGQLGWQVSLMVEHNNPAQRLYTRLGLQPGEEINGVYRTWFWTPSPNQAPPDNIPVGG